ncbi:TPA: putative DNA binding domain-containing protein [Staphylococcus aureus]|nr:putative DNA binding domain-containing protein [Staphylococcus aureus]HEI5245209.1 putative DNA binding domain-containing protein [Staphylococcus aureus]HEI5349423.1 putative DNA binding domain-containing protein [Staphylococcus aureus]HEI5514523.1 putative DNA binding domain-containing protein [Staphylococcus aureus]HEI5596681.1 putative DNA binding domain-containing protein [Staphylococcus aureus]
MTSSKYIEYLQTEVEGQLLDRKRASINPKDVAQHISAFANAEGGKLVIGIEDNGEISGFNHSKAKKKEVYIEAPFEHLYRIPKYTYEIIEVKKRDGTMDEILIFDIEPSYDAIITLKDDSVYLRINDKSRKLTHNQITNLEYDRGSRRFEEELVEYSSIEDVNEELVDEFKQLLNTNVDNEKLLKARGFMREGKLTVAGLLLFSNHINVYLPGARIRFMRYEGTKEESGTRLNIVKDITFDKALPEYPEFAWFEGMINSIVHRRYDNQGDHIRIKMFDDRLEISSPGALPASVTLENIKEERYSRNPKLAAALTQYKWVRESNEGVGRIFDEMKQYFLDDPVYSEPNNSSVQLALKNNIIARKKRETGRVSNIITPELFESLNEQQELIVRHLYNQGELTASKIANIIQRSVPTARKRLKELEEMNIISTHGSSKNDPKRTYYLLGFE